MASIEKRGSSFRIKVYVGEINGKKQFKTMTYKPAATTEKKALKEAQMVANRFEESVLKGETFDSKMTVEKYYREHWLKDFGYKLTAHELENTKSTIERVWLPEIGALKINEVKAFHIQTIINRLEIEGLKPRTISKYVSQMRPVFSTAYKLEVIQNNPFDRVSVPKISKTEVQAFSVKQAQIFLDIALNGLTVVHPAKTGKNKKNYRERFETVGGSVQFYALFLMLILGGFRRGEVLAMTWKDIDFDRKTVTVNKAVSTAKSQNGRYTKSPKTSAGYRTIDLPSQVFEYLRLWKQEQSDIARNLGSAWNGRALNDFDNQELFIQADGSPMDLSTPNRKMHNLIVLYNSTVSEDERLPVLHIHSLRHTSASQLVQAGADIATVAKRLGHSDLRVLLNVYTHGTEEELDRKASDTLESVFIVKPSSTDGELLGNYGKLN